MFINELAEKLYFQFSTRSIKDRPLIVGIDGLSGAGKTTLVKKIEQELNDNNCEVVTFHLDDHIVERNKRYQTGHEEWYEYYYLQWDIKRLTTHLFELLHTSCNKIFLPFYDKSTDSTSTKQITVASDSIVLIEGIFLQRQEWRRFYDFIIFLDCPRELRYKRSLNRDSYIGNYPARLNKYKRRYWLAEKHYLDIVKPVRNADLVYNA
ncbi:kinase [Alteribacter populi]|uniref:kinase n=1 Tax=Alteribacter populi TaxID=2011011 RepID=UPI000BBAC7EC|nr:kinase [Alteribacter populi]